MAEKIVVPTSADHPLGDGSGVSVTTVEPTPKRTTPRNYQGVGLLFFLAGLLLVGVAAYRITPTLCFAYAGVALIVAGVSLSYERDTTTDEEA